MTPKRTATTWTIGVPQAPLEIGVWPRKTERVQSGASGVKISSMRKSKMAAIWKARGNGVEAFLFDGDDGLTADAKHCGKFFLRQVPFAPQLWQAVPHGSRFLADEVADREH